MDKLDYIQMELSIANHFNYRQNLIVPNVSWGLFNDGRECDLLILSEHGYLTEIEIKRTKADIKADINKSHNHSHKLIKRTYFAIPYYLRDCADLISVEFGIIVVNDSRNINTRKTVEIIRAPKINKLSICLMAAQVEKLYRLAAMRIWSIKENRFRAQNKNNRSL